MASGDLMEEMDRQFMERTSAQMHALLAAHGHKVSATFVDSSDLGEPFRVIQRFALRLPEIRRLPGGMAWFESGPAVVNRYARVQVRSPFGVLVRDQWSYV